MYRPLNTISNVKTYSLDGSFFASVAVQFSVWPQAEDRFSV